MKELFVKIRDYYVEHLEVVKGMDYYIEILSYLESNYLQNGVCFAADIVFNVFGHRIGVIFEKYYRPTRIYWCDKPLYCTTKEQIIKSMETRISILNIIIKYDCN